MSSRDITVDYGMSAAQAFGFRERQLMKKVRTSGPGVVLSYDPETMRAVVQPSVDLLMADGRSVPRIPIGNVPVVWPGVGGYVLHGGMSAGDDVILVWCQRDISRWKATGNQGPPPSDRIMAEGDVVAVPLPSLSGGAAARSGVVLESLSYDTRIQVDGNQIRVRALDIQLDGILSEYESKLTARLTPASSPPDGFYGFNSANGGSISPSTIRVSNVSHSITGLWSEDGNTYATFNPHLTEDWVVKADDVFVGRLNSEEHKWDVSLPEAGSSGIITVTIEGAK